VSLAAERCGTGYRYVVLTGRPGVGKTTIFIRVLERLRKEGVRVEGFVCPEVRRGGRRIGFLIRSLDGKLERWLARVDGCDGPRVGRYYTCMEAVDVANYVLRRYHSADLVAVDEIGPMELRLPGVRSVILELLSSDKPGLYVVHERLRDERIESILKGSSCLFRVTEENRDRLPEAVYDAVVKLLRGARES
jgi:nucleoside-triphosphatase